MNKFIDDVKLLLARIEETYGHQVWFQEPRTDLEEAALKIHKHLTAPAQENLGEWQKEFVNKLTSQGVSYEHAMIAMGTTCDERQKTYMQGYSKGADAASSVRIWRNTDPRDHFSYVRTRNIVILRPSSVGHDVKEAGTGQVTTKEMWDICTSFDNHRLINADEAWDPTWVWIEV